MDLNELARLVKRCRDKQKEYFQTRNQTLLTECRDLERRVDQAVWEVLNPIPRGLFDQPIREAE